MKLLICGSRNWTSWSLIQNFLDKFKAQHGQFELIHGDCRGADKMGAYLANKMNMKVTAFPADWNTHGKAAGPIRNKQMIDDKPDYVVAFKGHTSVGTKNLINIARSANIKVEVIRDNYVS